MLAPVGPDVSIGAVTNAASNLAGSLSPGQIVVLYGTGIGPPQLALYYLYDRPLVDVSLADTRVLFNGTPAPMIYAWATQVAAIVPYSVTGGNAQVHVEYQGQTSDPFPVRVAASAPGVFTLDSTGRGQAAALNQDGSINTAVNPAPAGSIVSLFATGEGQTSPAGVDGKPAARPAWWRA